MRLAFFGSRMIVCTAIPPAPGCHKCPLLLRKADSSFHVLPPSTLLNIAASSAPAYTVSGSVSDGSTCQIRLNSHGCCVPSYHLCVPISPSYSNMLLWPLGSPSGDIKSSGFVPGGFHVFPPSSDR